VKSIPKITGIILAAGKSSRMGTSKQLLPFKGETILQWVIDNAMASSLESVVVVLGHNADIIAPTITGKNVLVVIHEDYKSGQSSSVSAGVRALPEGSDAVLFILGDQPLVRVETINRILDAFRASKSPIVIPVFDGKRGNPVLFSSETFQQLNLLDGDRGARPLFAEYAERVELIQVDDPYIHLDVDTEEDYRRLIELEAESPNITPVR
jgi:molybdenum cofactor cytidylyltransferase